MINEIFEKIIPINGKVIAKVLEKEEKTLESGIVLVGESVNQAMSDLRQAEVLSADSILLTKGEIVYYLRFVGTPLGDEFIILDEKDIIGKEPR